MVGRTGHGDRLQMVDDPLHDLDGRAYARRILEHVAQVVGPTVVPLPVEEVIRQSTALPEQLLDGDLPPISDAVEDMQTSYGADPVEPLESSRERAPACLDQLHDDDGRHRLR